MNLFICNIHDLILLLNAQPFDLIQVCSNVKFKAFCIKFHSLMTSSKYTAVFLFNIYSVCCRDARIAALEQSSAETEQIIADVRTEKYKHMEEVYQSNRKCAELEAK